MTGYGGLSTTLIVAMMLALSVMLVYILSRRNQTPLRPLFAAIIIELLVWEAAVLIGGMYRDDEATFTFVDNFAYLGVAFVPVSVLLLGLAYQRDFDGFGKVHLALLAPPTLTAVMIFTNGWHHLFYRSFSFSAGYVIGPYFYFHAVYSYGCVIVGTVLLLYAAIKESGALSAQAVVFLAAGVIPTVANIGYTLKLPGFTVYATPFALSVTVLLFIFAIFRLGLFRVVPIATRAVMNRISDSFAVVDAGLGILDCNQAFSERFLGGALDGAGCLSLSAIGAGSLGDDQVRRVCANVRQAIAERAGLTEDLTAEGNPVAYYTVEYTPIVERRRPPAAVVLFKDVTEHVNDLRTLRENQDVLLERERLASLGQMIGGIAHNLKSPIFAISGGVEQLQCLTDEYRDSVGDPDVNDEDNREIAHDMDEWLSRMRVQLSYMSDIITTVKGQATQFSEDKSEPFTVSETLKRSSILVQHSFAQHGCSLRTDLHLDPETVLCGDVNSLVQVLDNVIENAVEAYGDDGGDVRLSVRLAGRSVLFAVADDGAPIDRETQDLLFRQMTTTKGKNGTGLGLYMSYSTVKGMFRGNMWFRSKPGGETAFYIQIPLPSMPD